MNKEKRIPEIRFAGFTDDWEQRKFNDIVKRLSKTSDSNEIPKVEFEDIIAGEGRLNKDVSKKFDNRKGIIFNRNNILYGKLRPYLKNWLLADFEGIALGDFWVFESKGSEPDFVYSLIQAGKYQKVTNDTSGTKMPRSDWKRVSTTPFLVPNFNEQTKIGQLFRELDNTIALHQQLLSDYKQLKKAMLQQMIPQKGETVPKVRFAGFSDKWKNKKIEDLFQVTRGKVLAATRVSNIKTEQFQYPVYSSQTKNNGLLGFYDNYLFDTAITWTTDGANAGTVNFRRGKFYSTNVNGVLLSEKGYVNKAVAEILNRVAWKFVSKVGNPKLMNNIMSEIIIAVPSLEEQEKISFLFEKIDKTITGHEQKLATYQELKKAMLQRMFV